MDLLSFVLGLIGGIVLMDLFHRLRPKDGFFRIDRSDPRKDTYRLELNDLNSVSKKKILILKVDDNAKLSQQ